MRRHESSWKPWILQLLYQEPPCGHLRPDQRLEIFPLDLRTRETIPIYQGQN